MRNLFHIELGEFTIGWFLLSVVLGGLLGAGIKYMFEVRLPESFKLRQRIHENLRKYSYPLLQAASDVELRIETILNQGACRDWMSTEVINELRQRRGFLENTAEGMGYFYLSTLYVFARYFAWVEILKRETGFLDFPHGGKSRSFYKILHRITNSFRYKELWPISKEEINQGRDAYHLYRHAQAALGEMMIIEEKGTLACISFKKFVDLYTSPDIALARPWLRNLEKYFEGLANIDAGDLNQVLEKREYRILRLIAIQYWFYKLIQCLDPKFEKVQSRAAAHEEHILSRLPLSYRNRVVELPLN
ncbi:MAG: hypothetical protein ACJ76Y_00565 [Thermoanaerobaculia bacterium]